MNNLLYEKPSIFKFIGRPLYEDIANVDAAWYFFLCDLYLASTSQLKLSDCFTAFANNETDTVVWHGEYLGEGRRWSIRSEQEVIEDRS